MENKYLKQLEKYAPQLGISKTVLTAMYLNKLITDTTIIMYLVRIEYNKRRADIHRKGYEGNDCNKLCINIVTDLADKFCLSESTIWKYLK